MDIHKSFNSLLNRIILSIVIFAILTAFSGCGTDSSSNNQPFNPITFYGRLLTGNNISDETKISISDSGGNPIRISSYDIDESGAFIISLNYWPAGFATIILTDPRGNIFRNRIESLGNDTFVHINLLSTLKCAYLELRPDLSIDQARENVHDFIGIPDNFDLGDEVAHPYYSRFSPAVFWEKADSYPGGLNSYIAYLASVIDLIGTSNGLYSCNPWRENIFKELNMTTMQLETPSMKVSEEAAQKFSGGVLGKSLVTNFVSVIIKGVSALKEYEQMQAIVNGIEEIKEELSQVIQMLTEMGNWIAQRFNVSDYTTLSGQIAPDIAAITTAYGYVNSAYNYASAEDVTDLDTPIQNLYANSTAEDFYNHSQNIYLHQWGTDPHSNNMISLARSIVGADKFVGDETQNDFMEQVQTYAGYQAQAARVIAAKSQPGLLENASHPYVIEYNFSGNVGGNLNYAFGWVRSISDQMQQEQSYVPLPMMDVNQIYSIGQSAVFQKSTCDTGSGGNKYSYATSLESGGLKNWIIGNTNLVQALIKNNGGSAGLANLGFSLKPGPVTFSQQVHSCNMYTCHWIQQGIQTATSNGYLVLGIASDNWVTAGWIDDNGNYGKIGECQTTDIADALDSDRDFSIKCQSAGRGEDCYYAGKINGPVIIVNSLAAINYTNSAQAIATAKYAALALKAGDFTGDLYSNGASGTQGLGAYPVDLDGGPKISDQNITEDVFWQALDPDNPGIAVNLSIATISNLVQPSSPPQPTPQEFPAPVQNIGFIHWKPASFGKSVLFKATRYLPDGTLVTGSLTLASPVVNATPQSDAIDLFPAVVSTTNSYLRSTGFRLYATRHYASCPTCSGNSFEDVSTSSSVVYTSSDANVTIGSALVKLTGSDLSVGSNVVITVTDSASAVRKQDTCTIYIIQ